MRVAGLAGVSGARGDNGRARAREGKGIHATHCGRTISERSRVDQAPDENAALRLARAHRLSVYDAVYLELAQREGLPLATLDAELRRAATVEGVALVSRSTATPEASPLDPTFPQK